MFSCRTLLVCKVLAPQIYMYMLFIYSLTFPMTLLMTISSTYMAEEKQEFPDDELKLTFCKTG